MNPIELKVNRFSSYQIISRNERTAARVSTLFAIAHDTANCLSVIDVFSYKRTGAISCASNLQQNGCVVRLSAVCFDSLQFSQVQK